MSNIENDEKQTLVDHLDELRTRIIRGFLYLVVGMTLGWFLYPYIYELLMAPIMVALERQEGVIQFIDITEGFWMRTQISLISGLIIALPLLLLELWAFVRPGLTPNERRVVRTLPLAIFILLLLGVTFGYVMFPLFVNFFLSDYLIPPGAKPQIRVSTAMLFTAKLLLAFGLGFQLPIVMIALNRIGLLPLEVLTKRWREAVITILTLAAIITPSWDPFSMAIAAFPFSLLYMGTIGVIAIMDKRARKAELAEYNIDGPAKTNSFLWWLLAIILGIMLSLVIAAYISPSWDPFSILVAAAPILLIYLLLALVIFLLTRKKKTASTESRGEESEDEDEE